METPTIWGLNNSHGLFWEDRTDATQNTWIHDNKYTNGKNRNSNNHFKLYENIPRNGRGMVIWTKYDMARNVHGFPVLRVKIDFFKYVL